MNYTSTNNSMVFVHTNMALRGAVPRYNEEGLCDNSYFYFKVKSEI